MRLVEDRLDNQKKYSVPIDEERRALVVRWKQSKEERDEMDCNHRQMKFNQRNKFAKHIKERLQQEDMYHEWPLHSET